MIVTAVSDAGKRPQAAAFTLAEVLLVIGMLVLITAAAGLWVQRGMFAAEHRPPQEVFLAAASQARILAMQQGLPVLLVFDEQAQGFRLSVLDAASPGGQQVVAENLPWLDDSGNSGRWSFARAVSSTQQSASAALPDRDASDTVVTTRAQAAADKRFFALPQGGKLRVAFYLLYGEEDITLPEPLAGIRYHPSGSGTPVLVRMEDTASGFRLTLVPDPLANGLRLDARAAALSANGAAGGWR